MPIGLRCRRAGQTAFSLFKFAEGADYTLPRSDLSSTFCNFRKLGVDESSPG